MPTLGSSACLLLTFLFLLKHMIADFPLQNDFMRLGKESRNDWKLPLLYHCVVHAVCTFGLLLFVAHLFSHSLDMKVILLATAFDFGSHVVVDFVKARAIAASGLTPKDRYYWWAMGLDQFLHHATNLVIVFYIMRWLAVGV